MKRHRLIIGMEVIILGMIVSVVGIQAAGSNPPSNGVKYANNGQTTVEGALNDLYTRANTAITNTSYGNASAGDILKDKTALIQGAKVTGTMSNQGGKTVSASTVTKSGTDALIKVPTTGYYNTSSSLKVPISTLQDTIGGSAEGLFDNATAQYVVFGSSTNPNDANNPPGLTIILDGKPHTVLVAGSYYGSTDMVPSPNNITIDAGTILAKEVFADIRGFAILFSTTTQTSVTLKVPVCPADKLANCLNGTASPMPNKKVKFSTFIFVS